MNNVTKILTRAQIRELAPSVFAEEAHHSRSDRYGYVPTIEVVNRLLKADYVCVAAGQSKVRKGREDHFDYTKHLLRFQLRKYAEADRVVGGLVPEVLLINSHNGTSSFCLQAGLFRFVCTNGLVVQDADHGSIRIHHSGDIAQRVLEASDMIMEEAPKILRVTKEWDKISLTRRQQLNLAKDSLACRYKNGNAPVTADSILVPKRNEDEAPTLWRTFNTIQESLMMGGVEGRSAQGRTVKTRSITAVNNTLTINRELWALADAMARKAA